MNSLKKEWCPWEVINMDNSSNKYKPYAIIVLNTVIRWKPDFLVPLWNNAAIRLTVDGGTSRWYKWLQQNGFTATTFRPPEYITGDMDSVDKQVLGIFAQSCKSNIIYTRDQNETDFTKALKELNDVCTKNKIEIEHVLVVVDTSGRLDQIMANINTLFKAQQLYSKISIFQLANGSLTWLLEKGEHKIHIPANLRENNDWCALIPIGQQCDHITTTGLKWNLVDRTMKFGDLVSTSNTYGGLPFVTVKTEKTLLWSMSLSGISTFLTDIQG